MAPWLEWLRGQRLQPHESAAVLVQLANDGERNNAAYESVRERDCYYLRRKYQMEIRIASWFMLVLMFLERPMWTHRHENWNDPAAFPRSDLPLLEDSVTLPLYFVALCTLGWGVALEAGYEIFGMQGGVHDREGAWRIFGLPIKVLRGRKTARLLFVLMLTVWTISMVQVLAGLFTAGSGPRPFWVAPSVTLFLILGERSGSRKFSYLLRILPKFSGLAIFLSLFVIAATLILFVLIESNSEEKKLYYSTAFEGIWNVLAMLSSSNWPLPMVPSIQANRAMFLYFVLLIVIGSWGLMNIITGLLFSSIIEQRERATRLEAEDLEVNLSNAFAVLDPTGSTLVSLSDVRLTVRDAVTRFHPAMRVPFWEAISAPFNWCYRSLMGQEKVEADKGIGAKAMGDIYSLNASILGPTRTHVSQSMQDAVEERRLDALMQNLVEKSPPYSIEDGNYVMLRRAAFDLIPLACLSDEAMKLIVDMRYEESSQDSSNHGLMAFHSRLAAMFCWADTKLFDVGSDTVIALFCIQYLWGANRGAVFLTICGLHVTEAALRLISKGLNKFFESVRNTIDFVIALCLVAIAIYLAVEHVAHKCDNNGCAIYFRALILFRLVLFPRNLTIFERVDSRRQALKLALSHGKNGLQDIFYILLIMFCVASAFCEVGVMLFGGLIRKDGEPGAEIAASTYGIDGYWPLNFNDFASGMGTLLALLEVNNMHIICLGFEVPYWGAVRLYFLAWYLVGVLLLLNFLPAFAMRSLYQYYVESRRELTSRDLLRPGPGDRKTEDTAESSIINTGQMGGLSVRGSLRYMISRDSGMYKTLFPGGHTNVSNHDAIQSLQDEVNLIESYQSHERTESMNITPEESFLAVCSKKLQMCWRFAIAPISRVQIAGILIQHAKNGVPPVLLYTQAGYFAYTLRYKLGRTLRLCAWLQMMFSLLSLPKWTADFSNAGDNSIYPGTLQGLLRNKVALSICCLLLSLLAVALLLEGVYRWHETVVKHSSDLNDYIQITEDRTLTLNEKFKIITDPQVPGTGIIENKASYPTFSKLFGQRNLNLAQIIEYFYLTHFTRLFLFFLLIILNICLLIVSIRSENFISPLLVPLAPFIVLWFDRYSRRRFKLIGIVIFKFLGALVVFIFVICVMALFAKLVYEFDESNSPDGGNETYFGTFGEGMWTIFLIITSSGFPTQLLPSYERDRMSMVFFFVVMVVGAFIMLNVILLVVYSAYEHALEKRERSEEFYRFYNLKLAFEILDVKESGSLSYDQVSEIISELIKRFADFRKFGTITEERKHFLVAALDVTGSGKIRLIEFNRIIDVCRVKLKERIDLKAENICLPSANCVIEYFRRIGQSKYLSLVVILLFYACIGAEVNSGGTIRDVDLRVSRVVLVFASMISVSEFALKYFAAGKKYWVNLIRRCEAVIAMALVGLSVSLFIFDGGGKSIIRAARELYIIRCTFLFQVAGDFIPSLQLDKIGRATRNAVRRIRSLGVVFLCVLLLFSAFGVGAFGGLINRDPSREQYSQLTGSAYDTNGYWPFNFNDYFSGIMTLLVMLHVSDFHVICEAFTLVTNKRARLFFIAWYCFGVLLMLSTVKALFMAAYVDGFDKGDGKLVPNQHVDTGLGNQDIDRDTASQFRGNSSNFLKTDYIVSLNNLKFTSAEDKRHLELRIMRILSTDNNKTS